MDGREPTRTLGAAIEARRRELGWTLEEWANRVVDAGGEGFRQSDVSRLERGKVGLPRRDRLGRVAVALGLPLGELLARSGWAGAEAVVRQWHTAPRPSTPTFPPPALAPAAAPVNSSPAGRPAMGDPRLRELIAQAQATRAQSQEVLRRLEEAWGPVGRTSRGAGNAATVTGPSDGREPLATAGVGAR
ncbi:MAG: helix-turn-helix domain-containing protein [Chloroflexota bacterium]|nr:helix-turn-helix domain-containing protein [Chloroflexota bacterium]